MSSKEPLEPNQSLNPEDFELPSTTELNPRKKPAGKPVVKTDTAKPTHKAVRYPGLGNVTIVVH